MTVSGVLVKAGVEATARRGMSEVAVLKAHKINKVLPHGYRVDHDPDVAILRRPDGFVVGYFPIWTLNSERLVRAAELDLTNGGLPDPPG
jgi:hypothetical protein